MARTIAVRFTLAGGDVDFYKEEIYDTTLDYGQDIQLQENQAMPPYLLTTSDAWATLIIDFSEKDTDTKGKIDQLIDEELEMDCYYQYAYDDTVSLAVIHYPNRTAKTYRYRYGELAPVLHRLIFLQSS